MITERTTITTAVATQVTTPTTSNRLDMEPL